MLHKIVLVGVVVNRQAAGTGNFAQGIAKSGILQDEAHNVRVVANTRITLEFRQHFVRCLGCIVLFFCVKKIANQKILTVRQYQ